MRSYHPPPRRATPIVEWSGHAFARLPLLLSKFEIRTVSCKLVTAHKLSQLVGCPLVRVMPAERGCGRRGPSQPEGRGFPAKRKPDARESLQLHAASLLLTTLS